MVEVNVMKWFTAANGRRSAGLFALFLLACLGLPRLASANCSFAAGSPGTIYIYPPSSISLPRDSSQRTVLYTSPANSPPYQISVTCNGDSYGVHNSRGSTPFGGSGDNWFPITGTNLAWGWVYNGGASTAGPYGYKSLNGTVGYAGTTHAFTLAMIGPVTPGTVIPAGPLGTWDFGSLTALTLYLANPITINTLSCSVQVNDVPMGTYRATDFKGINTYSATSVPFTVKLNNCPAGLNSIQYRIDPTTAILNSSQSVVALAGGAASATGIGLQMLDNNGAVLPLSANRTFTGYNRSTGGNYSIPLQARYYQTAANVAPGDANSAITVTLYYQ